MLSYLVFDLLAIYEHNYFFLAAVFYEQKPERARSRLFFLFCFFIYKAPKEPRWTMAPWWREVSLQKWKQILSLAGVSYGTVRLYCPGQGDKGE